MTLPYVYKLTHLPSLNWYVGSRTAKNCHPDDGYMSSSQWVKPWAKSCPDEWAKTIICTGTRDQILQLEIDILVTMNAVTDPRSFNRAAGIPIGISGKCLSPSHKEKLRQVNIGKKHSQKSRQLMKAARAQQIITPGWQWSEESKQKFQGQAKWRCSCTGCKTEVPITMLSRWHSDCKTTVTARPVDKFKENLVL